MEDHLRRIATLCRFCGKVLEIHKQRAKRKSCKSKQDYKSEFLHFRVDIENDNEAVHPQSICVVCRRMFDRLRNSQETFTTHKTPVEWHSHSLNCEVCSLSSSFGGSLGRPKKRKLTSTTSHDRDGSETESASDDENNLERSSCKAFQVIQENLPLLDTDMCHLLFQDIVAKTGLFVLDPENLTKSIEKLPPNILVAIVKAVFTQQKEHISKDIMQQKGRSLSSITEFKSVDWLSSRNPVVRAAVEGLTSTNVPHIKQVSAVDQLYNLVQPNFVSPCMFACNLVIYSICRSRMAANIYGKLHPGGVYSTIRSFLAGLTLKVPELPSNDVLVAIDNDQVMVKHWTVRKENRAQVSVLTSVCCAELDKSHLQKKQELAPSKWHKNSDEFRQAMTEEDHKILRCENKRMLQELLVRTVKEHCKEGSQWKDEIDQRVEELKAQENTRVCPVCGTQMPKGKRKCTNSDCGVNLKAAEKNASGSDILGSALIAPVRKYQHRFRETQLGFTIEEGQVQIHKEKEILDATNEWSHVPSAHPPEPIKVHACDPVFVNPNSFDSMKEVLRRVGKAANVKRYHPNKEDARHWLSLTMDGLPYLVVRGIIDEVHICAQCEKEVMKSDFSSHDLVNHKGQIIEYVREFDWVVLRIGKLHVEMNMAKTLVNVTWEVFFSQMANEMGFKTEAAQKFAHKCSDHHKTASLIEIAHVGIWSELLVPYVKARLEAGERLSVNDYLYAWIPDDAFKCPRYRFMFLMAWKFFSAFKIFHIGVRRNNACYVHAGQMAFSSLFHRSSASKYALIDLYDSMDRASYPAELKAFVEETESVSTSGNQSKGEDMDACLEEINKLSKVWQHGTMNAIDWLRIFRNLSPLTKVREIVTHMTGLKDPKEDDAVCRRRYDYQDEVLAWRIRLRKERYLNPEFLPDQFFGMDGTELDAKLIDFEHTLEQNRQTLLKLHFIEKKARNEVPIIPLYVTKEQRANAEDVNNLTKAAILKLIEEKIKLINDDIVNEKFCLQLEVVKKKLASTKKELVIALYMEIEEELDDTPNQEHFETAADSEDDLDVNNESN